MTRSVLVGVLTVVVLPGPAGAQELADFDYENLSFRGVGVSGGYLLPGSVDGTPSLSLRADLGFLGPGLRVTPILSFWSSTLKDTEVARLERSVERLVQAQQAPGVPAPTVDLGRIDRSDLVLGLDAHVVWRVRYGFLTYAGVGAAAHFLDGGGASVDDTFVEDLLDSVTAGFNLHGGIEVPATSRLRVFGEARFEMLDDLYYPEARLGLQVMSGSAAPGEEVR